MEREPSRDRISDLYHRALASATRSRKPWHRRRTSRTNCDTCGRQSGGNRRPHRELNRLSVDTEHEIPAPVRARGYHQPCTPAARLVPPRLFHGL
jgi:hypothetical protein